MTSTPEKPEQDVVNFDKALSRVAGDEDMLRELAEIFLDESPAWMTEIEEALEDEHSEALFRAAHDVKGSAEVFAADAATQAAKQLERMGRDDDLNDADEALGALKAEMVWVRNALEDYLDR